MGLAIPGGSLALGRKGLRIKSGQFTPAGLSPSHWYKSSSLGGADGTAIASWTNSGSGGNATQATGANQPLTKTGANGVNGKPVALFNGTTNTLQTTSFSLAGVTALTFFVVARLDAAGSFPQLVALNNGGLRAELRYSAATLKPNMSHDTFGSIATNAVTTGSWHIIEGVFDTTLDTAQVGVDGALETPAADTAAALASSIFSLGARDGTSLFFTGAMAEIFITTNAMSTTNRTSLRRYLGSLFAISVP